MSQWIAHTLVSTTLLMLMVIAARKPVARAFGARAAYALWALPAVRMLLPPLPGVRQFYMPVLRLPARVHPGFEMALVPPDARDRLIVSPAVQAMIDAVPAPAPLWPAILLAAWLGIAILWFGWQVLRYRRFVTRALDAGVPLLRERGVEVLVSAYVSGPVAAGVARKRIFLPADFYERYDPAERRQALLHEAAHHDRLDLLANLAGLAVLAVHWWNPIAHWAHRAFRTDQELACDQTVLARADAAERFAYGSALVKSSCGYTPKAACALDRATEIKRRLTMIGRGPVARLRSGVGMLIAGIAICGGLGLTASSATSLIQPPEPPAIFALPAADPVAPAPPSAPRKPLPPLARPPRVSLAPVPPAPPVPPTLPRHAAHVEWPEAGLAPADRDEIARAVAEAHLAGRQAAAAGRDAGLQAEREMARTRATMAARCAAQGHPVAEDERDWGTLALCDKARFHQELRRSIESARAGMNRGELGRSISENVRRSLDRAMAGIDRMTF